MKITQTLFVVFVIVLFLSSCSKKVINFRYGYYYNETFDGVLTLNIQEDTLKKTFGDLSSETEYANTKYVFRGDSALSFINKDGSISTYPIVKRDGAYELSLKYWCYRKLATDAYGSCLDSLEFGLKPDMYKNRKR